MIRNQKEMLVLFNDESNIGIANSDKKNAIREKYEDKFKNDLKNISDKCLPINLVQITEWLDNYGCVISWLAESEDTDRQIKKEIESLDYIKAVYPDGHYIEKKGDWELKVYYRAKGTRSEGTDGFLFFQGKLVIGKHINEELETDLGLMKYYGEFGKDVKYLWEPSGWNYADKKLIKLS